MLPYLYKKIAIFKIQKVKIQKTGLTGLFHRVPCSLNKTLTPSGLGINSQVFCFRPCPSGFAYIKNQPAKKPG
ncbi:hypothetical protein CLOSTMETH_03563 [[Clostridium] methylpentosum DSM 5476]|uniref:Uncharacterized protein n=1 Tax=[Clostridium] methylpentosum DSM 5476 TaxID=537013 RepID=C0EI68_9FIRM|nr:hypothetical protein CLOSTMETH_03563 [[Clostridium] methylpentosum DSM 5476]